MRPAPAARPWNRDRSSRLLLEVVLRYAILALLSVALFPRVSLAAETPTLSKGVRVRLPKPSTGGLRLTGVIVGVTSDSITIDPDQGSADLTIPRRNLDQLEVSTGPRAQTLPGAGIGLAVGAGAGAAWGATMEPGFVGRSGNIVVGSMFIGAIGLALGAVVGTLTLTDRWVGVEVDGQPGTGLQGFRSETTIRVGLTFKP